MLMEKLVEHLHPFIEVKNPGVPGDAEMATWEMHMCCKMGSLAVITVVP